MEQLSQNNYLEGVSSERQKEFIDAKNNLKEVVENITYENLKKMVDGTTFDFIESFGGDINKYALYTINSEKIGNEPDIAAWHTIEKLNQIKSLLEIKLEK